jgi:hypothetical protein
VSGRARELLERILSLFRRRRLDDELREELAVHLEMAVEVNMRAGMSAQEARRRAMVRLGGLGTNKTADLLSKKERPPFQAAVHSVPD